MKGFTLIGLLVSSTILSILSIAYLRGIWGANAATRAVSSDLELTEIDRSIQIIFADQNSCSRSGLIGLPVNPTNPKTAAITLLFGGGAPYIFVGKRFNIRTVDKLELESMSEVSPAGSPLKTYLATLYLETSNTGETRTVARPWRKFNLKLVLDATDKVVECSGVGNGSGSSSTLSGTPGFLPLWTSPTSLGDSVLFQNSGQLGLGTSTPQGALDVLGTAPGVLPTRITDFGSLSVRDSGNDILFSTPPSPPFAFRVNLEGSKWEMATFENQIANQNNDARVAIVARQATPSAFVNVAAIDMANNSASNPNWWHLSMRANGQLNFHFQPTALNAGSPKDRARYEFHKDGNLFVETCPSWPVGVCSRRMFSTVAVSDRRMKKEIRLLEEGEAVAGLREIQSYRFRYKDRPDDDNPVEIGLMAQEVQKVFPELVRKMPGKDIFYVSYEKFAAVFVKAFQYVFRREGELSDEVTQLKREVMALREELNSMKSRLCPGTD